MVNFETALFCLLVPIMYVLTYIAGKYDLLYLICKMLEEKCKEYKDKIENNDCDEDDI